MAINLITSPPVELSPWPGRALASDASTINPVWVESLDRLARELGITLPDIMRGTVADDAAALIVNRLDRIGSVSSYHVEQYAPDAPDAIKSEAVVRLCGYLNQTRGAYRSKGVSGAELEPPNINSGLAFRHSGAMKFLARWHRSPAGECVDV